MVAGTGEIGGSLSADIVIDWNGVTGPIFLELSPNASRPITGIAKACHLLSIRQLCHRDLVLDIIGIKNNQITGAGGGTQLGSCFVMAWPSLD